MEKSDSNQLSLATAPILGQAPGGTGIGFTRHSASFRDPSSYIQSRDGKIYRRITSKGISSYRQLMESGLYSKLVDQGKLISHEELVSNNISGSESSSETVIEPTYLPHISYPYEWCFSQLKDAALLTLGICQEAIKFGMILKDASAYNVQFYQGKPILIDTGSFDAYSEGAPWSGYLQFCKHFLAPLALAAKVDIRFFLLLESHIDGVPLDIASNILPRSSWLSFGLLSHIHLHSKAQSKFSSSAESAKKAPILSKTRLLGLLDNLNSLVKKLDWKSDTTEWGDYYSFTNYSDAATKEKQRLVTKITAQIEAKTIWDLGGNTGVYSRAAIESGADVICWDIDPLAVERNYQQVRQDNTTRLLPLYQDLTNPSKGLGWANTERESFAARGPVDLVMALALIHHLAISNNVPMGLIAKYFSSLGRYLLIEFVPKKDSQVVRLLNSREDIFDQYHLEGFSMAFREFYDEIERIAIDGTERTLILLKTK